MVAIFSHPIQQLPLSLLLAMLALPVSAEVFKCQTRAGKTVYQSQPCDATSRQQRVIAVEEMTPEQRETARSNLQIWQQRQADEESARAAEARERQLERERQEALALQRRSVVAQEQQARAAAMRQTPAYNGGYGYAPFYPYPSWPQEPRYPYSPYGQDHGYHRHHDHGVQNLPPPARIEPQLAPAPTPGMIPPAVSIRPVRPASKPSR